MCHQLEETRKLADGEQGDLPGIGRYSIILSSSSYTACRHAADSSHKVAPFRLKDPCSVTQNWQARIRVGLNAGLYDQWAAVYIPCPEKGSKFARILFVPLNATCCLYHSSRSSPNSHRQSHAVSTIP